MHSIFQIRKMEAKFIRCHKAIEFDFYYENIPKFEIFFYSIQISKSYFEGPPLLIKIAVIVNEIQSLFPVIQALVATPLVVLATSQRLSAFGHILVVASATTWGKLLESSEEKGRVLVNPCLA